jgi:excisionase family DNA binding protein
LSEETILRWIRNKELKAYRLGKTYRVTKEDYQEFLDQKYTGKSDEDQRN